jgi:hypothetical protein
MTEEDLNTVDDVIVRRMILAIVVKAQSPLMRLAGLRDTMILIAKTLFENYHAILALHGLLKAAQLEAEGYKLQLEMLRTGQDLH